MKKSRILSALLLCAALLLSVPVASARASAPVLPVRPEETDGPGTPVALSAKEQYEANIFLSNFSEQGFWAGKTTPFESSAATEAELFSFAHRWAKINRPAAIRYSESYECLSLEDVNAIVDRYFDRDTSLSPANGTDYSAALGMGRFDWDHVWFSGGWFYYPAADGESHPGFSVVTEKQLYPNNRSTLFFTVYELDLDIYWTYNGIPAEYYSLTPAEAAARAAKGEITPIGQGEAFCSPCTLEKQQRESYMLLRYTLYPSDVD